MNKVGKNQYRFNIIDITKINNINFIWIYVMFLILKIVIINNTKRTMYIILISYDIQTKNNKDNIREFFKFGVSKNL